MQNIDKYEDILLIFQRIFRDVLEDDTIILIYETTASDIPEWDSLNHISLVVSIENFFQVRFTAKEIQDFENVGKMCEGVLMKIKS
jgi:acyl carrier protein